MGFKPNEPLFDRTNNIMFLYVIVSVYISFVLCLMNLVSYSFEIATFGLFSAILGTILTSLFLDYVSRDYQEMNQDQRMIGLIDFDIYSI